jgi:hypothetical protein
MVVKKLIPATLPGPWCSIGLILLALAKGLAALARLFEFVRNLAPPPQKRPRSVWIQADVDDIKLTATVGKFGDQVTHDARLHASGWSAADMAAYKVRVTPRLVTVNRVSQLS